MIRITKRSLVWTFTVLFCGLVIFQTWYSVQWVFTSTDHIPATSTLSPAPTSSSLASTSTLPKPTSAIHFARYQRDYTTLVAYAISLFAIYCLLFVNLRYTRFSLAGNPTSCNTELDPPALEQQRSIDMKRPSPLYLLWRRWWYFEIRCCDITLCLGTCASLLCLTSIHGLLVVWPLLKDSDTMGDKHLQQQLLSNRMAQLAIVDIAMAVGLSVRTARFWQWIGLHNGSSTLPWHRWFSRLGICCIIYHGCFQWTEHYYQHQLAKHQTQSQQLEMDPHYSSSVSGLDQTVSSGTVTWWDLLVWNPRYLTGNLMILCLLVLCFGSHPLVREKWYRLFRLTHGIAFLGLVAIGMWHHWTFVVFYVAVVGFWIVDIVSRWRSSQLVPILALEAITKDVVKLQVMLESPPSSCQCRRRHRRRIYLPGQYVFCSFSGTKWKDIWWSHPFSVSKVDYIENRSSENDESQILTFYIKACGKQTKHLVDMADIKEKWPVVRLGAALGYMPAYCHWTEFYGLYPVVVLVAEGIGVTPWIAVLQSLVNGTSHSDHHRTITEHIHLVWTARSVAMVRALQNDIQAMVSKVETGSIHLEWHIYVTGEEAFSSSSSSTSLQYQQGRPNYPQVLESIRSKHGDEDVALGICAHEESVKICGNIARSTKFSHTNAYWNVKSERFDL